MDIQYIEELKALDDKKEAKSKLAEYGATFGIVLKKSRTIDGMIEDLQAGLKELADRPMPEDNVGLSISDLIDADDELNGKFVQEDVKEEALLLFDAPVAETIEIKTIVVDEPITETHIESPIGDIVSDVKLSENTIEEAVAKIIETEKPVMFELPDNFSPTVIKLGPGNGYVTLPWWIYDWITQNPDWKQNPGRFPHHYGIPTLHSLIYFIKREGSVRIRETRNSSFVVLN